MEFSNETNVNEVEEAFNALKLRSELLPYEIPTVKNQISQFDVEKDFQKCQKIVEFAKSTCPIADQRTLDLMQAFIAIKMESDPLYKLVYDEQNIQHPNQLVARLLSKRPLVFYTNVDIFLTRLGQSGSGKESFPKIGTNEEREPICLKQLQSYDEMALSALVGVSGKTFFINDGSRQNIAVPTNDITSIETEGVYIGLVGPRFERPQLMEWKYIVVDPKQNTEENGYGLNRVPNPLMALWASYYGVQGATKSLKVFDQENFKYDDEFYFPSYEEVKEIADSSNRYVALHLGQGYFDTEIYKARIVAVIRPYLINANIRAERDGKKAFCHFVGLGLGVWQIHVCQPQIFVDAVAYVCSTVHLPYISDLYFAWFKDSIRGSREIKNFNVPPGVSSAPVEVKIVSTTLVAEGTNTNHFTLHFGRREPASTLNDPSKIVIPMFAWDSNAYVGNEYYNGFFAASGDPAAACCSFIPELQNPDVNPDFLNRL